MWRDQRLCDLFGIEHPIIQAPMAGSTTPELAAAVSEAGGLGSLGCASMTAAEVRNAAARLRARTNRPFNLNFFVHPAPQTNVAVFEAARSRLQPFYDRLGLGDVPVEQPALGPGFTPEKLAVVLEARPKLVSFHFGLPDDEMLQSLKQAGILVISTASTVAEAKALEARGVDTVIAQGWEAGGHRGSHKPTAPHEGVGTMALVPQVVDAIALPVIAAGGIGDGRGIVAALALGASGVQMGTAFLSCPEAATDSPRRALLRQASDTDTMVTDAVSGRAARAVRSRYAEEMERHRQKLPDYPAMYALSDPLTDMGNDAEASFHLYGQAAALNVELPARELMARLVEQTRSAMARLVS